jgi:hypothetical protein
MEELMKVGDSIIITISSRFHGDSYRVSKIIKVNKKTYKVTDGCLYYIDGLYERTATDSWTYIRNRIKPYSIEAWNDIKLKIKKVEMGKIQKELAKIVKSHGYDLVLETFESVNWKE